MSKLISVIHDIIRIFQTYSQKDCSHIKLNKDELNLLIQNEFADVIKNPKDPKTISSLLQILDEDNDGEVDFNEFCDLLCKVLKAYYKVVYEKEDTCQHQDQPKKDGEMTSDTTSKVTDEPPKFYQKPLYPKSDKIPSVYHDQKGVSCGDQSSKVETTQVSTQTEPKKADSLEAQDSSKQPTIKIEEASHTSTGNQYGKDQISQPDNTGSSPHDDKQSNNQKPPQDTSGTQSQGSGEGKDTTSKPDTTEAQPASYSQGKAHAQQDSTETQSLNQAKDHTSPQAITGSQGQTANEWSDRTRKEQSDRTTGKQMTSPEKTIEIQAGTYSQEEKQRTQPHTTVSQPHGYESDKDQTQGTSSQQSMSEKQDKAQTCHEDTTSSDTQHHNQSQQHDSASPQSVSSEKVKVQLDTTGSQSHHENSEETTSSQSHHQGKEPETVSHTPADQPGHTEEPKKFYQKPVYLPPVQGLGLSTSQPPPYTQTQEENPNSESHQIPQVPQQPQKTMFYQYQQTFSSQKKNP
ncbi:uncharacterized protein ACNLHF_003380 [Anomaloglossus baeobatrachus]|uniref:uncharacterized protein LOC142257472 n=1 Tax=Anomaloglossus baeobatrachus TaxID=238106 RepID=UPI003F501827